MAISFNNVTYDKVMTPLRDKIRTEFKGALPVYFDNNYRDIGTKSLDGKVYNVDIEVWSQYRGQKEIKEVMERVYNLFNNATISVSGASSVMSFGGAPTTLGEADGLTRHGIVNVDFTVYDN